jgi:hypothetical protein
VIARWIWHLLAVDVAVEPLTELRDAPLSWYVGLSADVTRIGDAIWNGKDMDSALQARLVGLYRLNFNDPSDVIEKLRGEPVYLLAAMTADEMLRLKPQNLVNGLPIRARRPRIEVDRTSEHSGGCDRRTASSEERLGRISVATRLRARRKTLG